MRGDAAVGALRGASAASSQSDSWQSTRVIELIGVDDAQKDDVQREQPFEGVYSTAHASCSDVCAAYTASGPLVRT